jgi:ribonuclease D
MGHRLVTEQVELEDLVAELRAEPRYAVDTEFHRERTYWPHPALIQVGWTGGIALIDPLAVDLAPVAELLRGPGLVVMHAAAQDLEVLQVACGELPRRLFDTQVAAGFVGFSTPSLSVLTERVLDIALPKASRLTDWLRRPLDDAQQEYAASDVAHLLDLHDALASELEASGRLGWVEEECEAARTKVRGAPEPDEAWLRMKESRQLRGGARHIAQTVAAWRERTAAELDKPVRQVLPDLAVVAIANDAPADLEALRRLRGVDDRYLRGGKGHAILEAVAEGRSMAAERLRLPSRDDLDRDLRPAVTLVSAWVSQLGRDVRIDPTLLATRNDLVALLSGAPDARLASGWRAELLGEPIRRLVDGRAALAFAGEGSLVLEQRSEVPVTVDLPRPSAPWARTP